MQNRQPHRSIEGRNGQATPPVFGILRHTDAVDEIDGPEVKYADLIVRPAAARGGFHDLTEARRRGETTSAICAFWSGWCDSRASDWAAPIDPGEPLPPCKRLQEMRAGSRTGSEIERIALDAHRPHRLPPPARW